MLIDVEALPLRKKLMLSSLMVTGLAILIGLAVSIIEDVRQAESSAKKELVMISEVIATNSTSALLFNDAQAAKKTLSVLSENELIIEATIQNHDKQLFAQYRRKEGQTTAFFDALQHQTDIVNNGQILGVLVINANLKPLWNTLFLQWLIKFAALTLLFAISYLILRKAIRNVLEPIQRLLAAVHDIKFSRDYALRVEQTSTDELGQLTMEFNSMLAIIEKREQQLQQSNEALAQVQEPIVIRDADLKCQYINPAFTKLFGYTQPDLINKNFLLTTEQSASNDEQEISAYHIARDKGVFRGETYRKTKSGKILPVQRYISPVKDKQGEVKGYVTVLSDISEKKHAENLIWRQANFDSLTGLPNRLMFNHRLKQEIAKMNRANRPLALMFLDLDHFKEINDTLGHDMGDELLKEAAKRIMSCVRETDEVGFSENIARLGGDEFTIMLTEVIDQESTEMIAQRVLNKLSQPFQLNNELVHISASIGIVIAQPHEQLDTETLVKYADIAMYDAKQKGRNCYSHFSQTMLIAAQKRRRLINDIYQALQHQEFQLVYQPIIDLETNAVIKAEALIRWYHPTEGLVNPVDFISVAEDAGIIVEIGDWVFREAVKQSNIWREKIHPDFQVSVNKSPVQINIAEGDRLNWLSYMAENNLPAKSVAIEITEGLFLNNNAVVSDKLLAYRDAGVEISLDDFGTGYSSLSYLQKFDIDYIKIDQSFVQNLTTSRDNLVLCEAMIVMAHKLGIKVIAEGIETSEQLEVLQDAGCDFGQGYVFSKPLSTKAFELKYTENAEQLDLLSA